MGLQSPFSSLGFGHRREGRVDTGQLWSQAPPLCCQLIAQRRDPQIPEAPHEGDPESTSADQSHCLTAGQGVCLLLTLNPPNSPHRARDLNW